MMLSHSGGGGGGGGSENMNPALSAGVYPRRGNHQPIKSYHTKHTIITREARLGRSGGGDIMNQYHKDYARSRHAPSSQHHGGYNHGYHLHQHDHKAHLQHNISSSSSNSTASMTPQELSNIFFPSLLPHVSDRRAEHHVKEKLDHVEELDQNEPDITVIVAYIGSIEMPSEANLPGSHQLQSIRSAVRRLRWLSSADSYAKYVGFFPHNDLMGSWYQ